MDKKIALDRYEMHQKEITRKATTHFYIILILNIVLAIPTLFEPDAGLRGIITLSVSVLLSVLVFCGVKFSEKIWVVLDGAQLIYYFFKLGVYLGVAYPMTWFLFMCARCVFCLYSGWAFLISYDINDVVREHGKKLFKKSEK